MTLGGKPPRPPFADLNVAMGSQPHSEVGALAIFLLALRGDAALAKRFEGGEVHVEPSAKRRVVRPRADPIDDR